MRVSANGCRMMILNEVHGQLPCVSHLFSADGVCSESFLHEDITAILFIFQEISYRGNRPSCATIRSRDLICLQPHFNHLQAGTSQKFVVDSSDHHSLRLNESWLTVFILFIGIQAFIPDINPSLSHGLPDAPLHILADGFAFGLGEGTHDGCQHFAVFIQSVDALFLELNRNAEAFQEPDIVQTVYGVSGKSGDGLHQDQVDFLLLALPNHLEEFRTLGSFCAGDALICEDTGHRPFRIRHDLICIVGLLCLIAGKLFFVIGRHSAIGSDAKLAVQPFPLCQFQFCRNDDYLWGYSVHRHPSTLLSTVCPFFSRSFISPLIGIRMAVAICGSITSISPLSSAETWCLMR